MAKTKGHGNPKWSREEVILALELYNQTGGEPAGKSDTRVLGLSNLLRSLPYHAEAAKLPTFRNADGVAFKLQNLRQVATGRGLPNVAAMDRQVWSELGDRPAEVSALANAIRAGMAAFAATENQVDEDEEFAEGRLLSSIHYRRERNPEVRRKLLRLRASAGALICDLCGRDAGRIPAPYFESVFEAHHVAGLANGAALKTRLRDMSLLHANCHRLLHAIIRAEKVWLTPAEAKVRVGF